MSHRLEQPDRPWMMRTYAGHSTARKSNELYRGNLAKGQTGLSIAFDLPTQTGYDADHGVDEWHGTNAFLRDGDRIFRTYFINSRGDESMGSTWSYLDMTALGRQEEWESSPEGYPQTAPYQWWHLHDEYPHAA